MYVILKSKPNGQVECIAAEHGRVPTVHDRTVSEVQIDVALAIYHLQAHGADRPRRPLQQRKVDLRNVNLRCRRQFVQIVVNLIGHSYPPVLRRFYRIGFDLEIVSATMPANQCKQWLRCVKIVPPAETIPRQKLDF